MKYIFCVLLALLLPRFGKAQNGLPSVTNLAGYDFSASGVITTVSIGEPAILTLTSDNYIITQGFLQPEILPCKDITFNYYPNPTKGEMTVEAFGCEAKIKSIEILDMWGRIIASLTPTKDNKLQLGFLSSGVYIMKISLSNGQVNTISIVKVI